MSRVFCLYLFFCYYPLAVLAQPLNPEVTQATIRDTICVKGYTKTVRPPTNHTNSIKYKLMEEQGYDASLVQFFALDHRIPLTLGGHPRSLENLQLIGVKENGRKSRVEVKLNCLVCSGQLGLSQAQEAVWSGWEDAYHRYAKVKCQRN